ncbi:hypothetical protein M408DRAFT_110922 [Serendipita vermifera MAFF 305830]|uniref:F-box domain-containing protein n=1 Tax=Serendipita vermifera MAFF 305830 TaxID=933852 RepID=A0A0C3APM4_SERVB|nr:hypothetical protein M408DRAFT_110922 [Serendipita vermifera MAFF 305830]
MDSNHIHPKETATRQRPLIRYNRNPLPSETGTIQEETSLNDALLETLRLDLGLRRKRLETARINAESKSAQVTLAELQAKDASKRLSELTQNQDEHSSSSDAVTTPPQETTESPTSQHALINTKVANIDAAPDVDLILPIEKATTALRLAQEILTKSLEEEQDALLCEEQCLSVIHSLEFSVDAITKANNKLRTRAIWRIHEEIWIQVFLEAAAGEPPLSSPLVSLALSTVCQLWRTLAHSIPSLWNNIHVHLGKFGYKDTERVAHYFKLSKGNPVAIILELQQNTRSSSVILAKNSLSHTFLAESVTITGDPLGATVTDKPEATLALILPYLPRAPKIQYIYPSDVPTPAHQFTCHIAEKLEEVVMENCILCVWRELIRPHKHCRLRNFVLVAQTPPPEFRWEIFCDWLSSSASTMISMVLDVRFKDSPTIPENPPIISFSCLKEIKTTLDALLLLSRSSVYTPVLESLQVICPTNVDLDEWDKYSRDIQGGANITKVTLGSTPANDWENCVQYLRHLPQLQTLELRSAAVHSVIEGLNKFESPNGCVEGTGSSISLKELAFLMITDYNGDWEPVLSFARRYLTSNRDPLSQQRAKSQPAFRLSLCACSSLPMDSLQELRGMGLIT